MGEAIRGKEYNQRRARQPKDYSGLCYGKITPMDLDGILEFSDRLFIFLEYKGVGAPLKYGQKLCIERVVNAIHSERRIAVAIVADHWGHIGDDIDCAGAEVREIFFEGEWHCLAEKRSVASLIDSLCEKYLGYIPK